MTFLDNARPMLTSIANLKSRLSDIIEPDFRLLETSELHGNGDGGITAVMGTKLTVIPRGWCQLFAVIPR